MLITCWNDKGGGGKTTLATGLAKVLGVPLLDLDPQRDSTRWAAKAGVPCVTPATIQEQDAILQEKAESHDWMVVDTHPGQERQNLLPAAIARLAILPTRPGPDDIVAFHRGFTRLHELLSANKKLQIGVVLNAFRSTTSRSRAVQDWLIRESGKGAFHYLGHLSLRQEIEDAKDQGLSPLALGGDTAHEMRAIADSARLIMKL